MAVRAGVGRAPDGPKAAVPAPAGEPVQGKASVHEPVWLVRIVLALFLLGFAAFLAREVRSFLEALP